MMRLASLGLLLGLLCAPLGAEDLAEPLKPLIRETNQSLLHLKEESSRLEESLRHALSQKKDPEPLLQELMQVQKARTQIEKQWRAEVGPSLRDGEEACTWDVQALNLSQLLADYAPPDLIYLVPSEFTGLPFYVHTQLPIPEASSEDFLRWVLLQGGLGVRTLHPLIREVFPLSKDLSALRWLIQDRETLQGLEPQERVCFFLPCTHEDALRAEYRLKPFIRAHTTTLLPMGDILAICAPVGELMELLKLHDFLGQTKFRRDYRLISLRKSTPEEMARVLLTIVGNGEAKEGSPEASHHLKALPLSSLKKALLLVGSSEQLRRAEEIAWDLEGSLQDPSEKTIYRYACQHTPPEELATVLERVYCMLQECQTGQAATPTSNSISPRTCMDFSRPFFSPPNCPAGPINIQPISAGVINKGASVIAGSNFIVDNKSGSILMVVEQRLLTQLQELAKRLDTPKRMVQLDVLMVERRIKNNSRFGLNLLRIGTAACNCTGSSMIFHGAPGRGLFEFLLSQAATCHMPAYDLTYNFLLNHEDVQVNANPSLLTVNQTPATISVVEEISINNGAISCCDGGAPLIQKSFVRAQYGITLVLTPTIHLPEGSCRPGEGSVTLDTNIQFDSTRPHPDERPDVVRRHIENQVRVGDGETVILGGLRRKESATDNEAIPFLGEIPGLGKLFGSTAMAECETEMFIFITPRIVLDPQEDLRRIRQEELERRPGDLPEFIACVEEAKRLARDRLFARSIMMVTGESPGAPRVLPCSSTP